MKIGNATDARYALKISKDAVYQNSYNTFKSKILDNGWEFIAAGTYRRCFLSPSKVLYKINVGPCYGLNMNEREYDTYLATKDIKLPHNFKIPATSKYSINGNPVIAMEYIKGKFFYDYYRRSMRYTDSIELRLGLTDLHPWNILLSNGVKYVIDLGG